MPTVEALDTENLDISEQDLATALTVDIGQWQAEIPSIEEWFDKIGDKVPSSLRDELASLKQRLG